MKAAILRMMRDARHGAVAGARAAVVALALVAALPASVLSQASEPTAADRQAAGQAYDRATAAYLAHDYARAATLFETAYRLAPASASLLQAVRAHERAGNGLRAATLALRLQAFYGSDAAAARQADTTLAATSAQFLRIDVTCNGTCTLELDGVLQEHTSFFAAPGAEHTVRATFDTGPTERGVNGAAGATEAVSFDAPAAALATGGDETNGEPEHNGGTDTGSSPSNGSGAGLSPIAFVIAVGATAVAGGVLTWSGIDALDGVPAYRDMPTMERLRDGQSRELRTNILIGVTGALALTSLILAIFTDWDGEPESADESTSPQVALFVSPDAAMLMLGGRFR